MNIKYIPNFVNAPDGAYSVLRTELQSIHHDKVPRLEYYVNDFNVPYRYGTEPHARTYFPQVKHPLIAEIWDNLEATLLVMFDVCFLNWYPTNRDYLGWHADDSPEMDDGKPIVSVSLGAARPIQTRDENKIVTTYELENGSAFVMPAHFQEHHQHRIPKTGNTAGGGRISLTFRGYNDSSSVH